LVANIIIIVAKSFKMFMGLLFLINEFIVMVVVEKITAVAIIVVVEMCSVVITIVVVEKCSAIVIIVVVSSNIIVERYSVQ